MTTVCTTKYFDFFRKIWYNKKIMNPDIIPQTQKENIIELVEKAKQQEEEIVRLRHEYQTLQKKYEENITQKELSLIDQSLQVDKVWH